MLKLNTDKTELIVFSPKPKPTTEFQLNVGDNIVKAVPFVRNLGAMFDSGLHMDRQINAVTKSCFFQIRNIGCIRKHISTKACKTIIQALVTSRLDYGNGLLCGVTDSNLAKLQRVQNTAARLVAC